MCKIEQSLVIPVIKELYAEQRDTIWQRIKDIQNSCDSSYLTLAGDGTFDSAGFCANYCTYFLQDSNTGQILTYFLASKDQTSSSGKMEPFAASNCVTQLWEAGMRIGTISTDRSLDMKNLIENLNKQLDNLNLPRINHVFDPWHWIHSVTTDLRKLGNTGKGSPIKPWINSTSNMLWYSFENAQGDLTKLREMIASIPSHISNIHIFPENKSFLHCNHEEIERDWIQDKAIVSSIANVFKKGTRWSDLSQMTELVTTSEIESINALLGTHATKKTYYPRPGMEARVCMCILDHNENVGRPIREKYKIKTTRHGSSKSIQVVRDPKTSIWKTKIKDRVVEYAKKNRDKASFQDDPDLVFRIPNYKSDKRSKSDLIEDHMPRLTKKRKTDL